MAEQVLAGRPITEEGDFLRLKAVDHLHFWVGNAKHAMYYWWKAFGFRPMAYAGLETGHRQFASYVLESGKIRFVVSAPYGPSHEMSGHHLLHGDGVKVIALSVDDVEDAFRETTARGAQPAWGPREEKDEHGVLRSAAIHAYGEVLHVFIDRGDYNGPFAPGYRALDLPTEFGRPGGRRPRGRQRPTGEDGRLGALLPRGDGLPAVNPLQRPGHRNRVLGADVEGDGGRGRAHQVPD